MHRTDLLAARKGLAVQELADIIGISRRTLFAARNNDIGVTAKTWLKLEAAERMVDVNNASSALTKRFVAISEAAGGTEEEKQALFEDLMDKEKMPLIQEIIRLRDEVEQLRGTISNMRKLLE